VGAKYEAKKGESIINLWMRERRLNRKGRFLGRGEHSNCHFKVKKRKAF
jgi:hypothetical protein